MILVRVWILIFLLGPRGVESRGGGGGGGSIRLSWRLYTERNLSGVGKWEMYRKLDDESCTFSQKRFLTSSVTFSFAPFMLFGTLSGSSCQWPMCVYWGTLERIEFQECTISKHTYL